MFISPEAKSNQLDIAAESIGEELTEQEKLLVRDALRTEKEMDNHPERFASNTNWIREAESDAQRTILNLGRRVLPYLREQLMRINTHDVFRLSCYTSALAETEDLRLVSQMFCDPKVIKNPDGSSLGHFYETFVRLSYRIRRLNPDDEVLKETVAMLAKVLPSQVANRFHRHNPAFAIALTGTQAARDYLEAHKDDLGAEAYQEALRYHADAENLSPHRRNRRYHFTDWREIYAARKIANEGVAFNDDERDLSIFDDDLYPFDDDDDLGDYPHGYGERFGREDYDHIGSASAEEKLSDVDIKNLNRIQGSEYRHFEPTAMPATKLHLYNFLKNHPDASDEDFLKEIKKCRRYSEQETKYGREDDILPTIGIEIEIPREYLDKRKADILDELGIPNQSEIDDLWEANPEFTYSPWVQARMIQELAMMGALPLENIDRVKKVISEKGLSLHINLGPPCNFMERIIAPYADSAYALNDIMNYAFTSGERLKHRKTSQSLSVSKKARDSKKSRKKASSGDSTNVSLERLELRASEFRDYPSYRMLAEVQQLGAALFSFIKVRQNLPTDNIEQELARIWSDFYGEAQAVREKYGLEANIIDVDSSRDKVIYVLKNTDLRQASRRIFSRYAREVGKIIKLSQPESLGD